jgi:hypothetical protein
MVGSVTAGTLSCQEPNTGFQAGRLLSIWREELMVWVWTTNYNLGLTIFCFESFTKEADECWSLTLYLPSPNLMLEVGFWKPTREIETDARGWIKTRGSPVRLVVKISIERNTPEIIIRRWELCRRENPSPRALAFSFSVSHAQEIGVLRSANPATGNLVLPFEEVMGRPGYLNNPLEHDFIISQAELEDMGKNVFTEQGFIS